MDENYTKFIKSIELSNITLLESSEKLFFSPTDEQLKNIRYKTEHSYNRDDPVIKDTEMQNRHKYRFSFYAGDKIYYTAEYVLFISFSIKDKTSAESLLKIDEVRTLFIEKQIHKLIWSYLRGIVLDSFNRHSQRPVPLPLLA